MAETMEEYMCKTRGDYGSGVTRPKIDAKDHFELKSQFLKELRDNTFSSSDHEDANEHIEKVLHNLIILEEKSRRLMKRYMLLRWDVSYVRDPTTPKTVHFEEAYYTQFGVPFQQGRQYRAAALGFYQRSNANPSYQEQRQSMEESLSNRLYDDCCDEKKGSYGLQCLDDYSNRATLLDDSLPKKEKDPRSFTLPCYINNVCFEKALADLGASISVMPLSTYLNLGIGELAHTKLTVELAYRTMKHPKGIAKNVLVGIGKFVFPVAFIILDMLKDVNVPLILGRPFLSIAHAKVDVFKRKITLRVEDEKIIFKSVKPASSLIKRVYMLSLRKRMDLNLEARLMEETLILNRSLDPLYGDYIELNDLNEPLELRRNRVDDLEPTIEECEVVNEPMMDIVKTRCDFISGLDNYPSNCDFDRRIHIDCAYNLKFLCMMGFEYVHANFLPILPINVMSKKFYNSIMKDKIEFKGRNELGNFVNASIFIRNFYVITDFTVMEDMDPYLDEGMGDVIVGEPFCNASCVEPRRFDGIITIHDGKDSVTYQMTDPYLDTFYRLQYGVSWFWDAAYRLPI
ncbi:putative reverse transcriptase domain-containing protein [Tanacetum coccineum]